MEYLAKLKQHKKLLIIGFCLAVDAVILLIVACWFIIDPSKQYIVDQQGIPNDAIGIVLGAGISKDGKPFNELKARLNSAADALEDGKVDKLILSGDNRFENYDEPTAMKQYMVETKNIPEEKMVLDYAGRSTYESCERAYKIFGVKKLIIFSAGSHLPRAIYLCRDFGIESYGISSGLEANNSTRRELLARVKAVYNAKLIGEPTVLGDHIPLN